MRTLIKILLAVLLLCGQVWADSTVVVVGQPTAGAAASCQATPFYDSTGTASAYFNAGQSATNFYAGYQNFNPSSNKSICKIEFVLTCPYDSCSSYSYYAAVYAMDGNNLGSLVGAASAAVTGVNEWADTTVAFTFATRPSVANGTNYGLVVYNNTQGDNQLVRVNVKANNGYASGQWNSSFTRVDALNDNEMQVKVYAYE